MTSDGFASPSSVVSSGGSAEGSANFKLYDTIGQPSVVGTSEGTTWFTGLMGFIYTIFGEAERPGTLECEWLAGGNIKVKWQGCQDVDIHVQTPASGYYYEYNGDWDTEKYSCIGTTEWVDTDARNHEQRYYRVTVKGINKYALAPSGSIEAVGKFDLDLPNTQADSSKMFISTPLEPFNSCITYEIGIQASERDIIGVFDMQRNAIALATYRSGAWIDGFTGDPATFKMELGRSYAYYTRAASKKLVMVGRVCDTAVTATFEGGDINTKCAYIASAYPVARDVNSTVVGLNDAGISASLKPWRAGSIGLYDNNWNALKFAAHTSASNWQTYADYNPPFNLEPGRGYVVVDPVNPSITWVQRP
jgi:hypothetical protein